MAARPTVLVADDNADICDLLQVGLSKLAVDVEVANNGREAYEKSSLISQVWYCSTW